MIRCKASKLIVATNAYSDSVLGIVRSLVPDGFDLLPAGKMGETEFCEAVASADYLLVGGRRRLDQNVLSGAKHLKMIQRTGVGLDSLDLEYITQSGIPLYVNQGVNAQSVAEHALMLTLAVLRSLTYADCRTKQGKWDKHDIGVKTHELYGKTVGIVGMGNIGRAFRALLEPFHVRILYTNTPQLDEKLELKLDITFASLDELLRESDIVSLHCPLTSETKHLIGAAQLSTMKSGAVLINTARGGLVDEASLCDALNSGHLAGAGLDVFEKEPPQCESSILQASNVVSTPHIAGITSESYSSMIAQAMFNIEHFEKGDYSAIAGNRWKGF